MKRCRIFASILLIVAAVSGESVYGNSTMTQPGSLKAFNTARLRHSRHLSDRSSLYLDDTNPSGSKSRLSVTATEESNQDAYSMFDVDIIEVESDWRAPAFISLPSSPITLLENFTNFHYNIATLEANSNTDETAPLFELVTGHELHTNKLKTFRLITDCNTAYIRLGGYLDYETVAEYVLTIRILNKYNLVSESNIIVQVEDVNDNIPIFKKVSSGLVKETDPPGTPVLQVYAIDRDGTAAHNQVTYELKDDEDNFSIDPYTGNITTLKAFVWEKQHSYIIKVIATDNSPSALFDTWQHNKGEQIFKIEIGRKDGHSSSFVIRDSDAKIENTLVTDSDFKIINNNTGLFGFSNDSTEKLSMNTSKLRHSHRTSERSGTVHSSSTSISDNHRDAAEHFPVYTNHERDVLTSSSINMDNSVVESHKKVPAFISISESPIILRENFTDFSYNIATLIALSNTSEEAPVFELVTGLEEQTNKLGTFRLVSQRNVAHIRLGRYLDYEAVAEYMLTIRLTSNYKLVSESNIIIHVEDVNDHIPVFTKVASGVVFENDPPGTHVLQVYAVDGDGTTAHNKVTYQLADNQENFLIDSYTGNITTLISFDPNKQDIYHVKVIATDNSPSSLLPTGEPNKGEHVYRIKIADKNHSSPRVVQQAIHRNSKSKALLNKAMLLGTDSDDTKLNHRITRRTHKNTARLRHSRHSGNGRIELKDERLVIGMKKFQGENHKPIFSTCSNYHPKVKEEEPMGTFVFQVNAEDIDPPDNGGNVTYTFVSSGPGDSPRFSIDPRTGVITTKSMFDRDEPNREKEVYLTVRATDNGRPQLDDACTIKVTIEDVNDNSPVFDKVNYQESVPQDLMNGTEVMRISATDIDDGNNSIVLYDLKHKDNIDVYFKIDTNTGVISLVKTIDKDPGYKFQLCATATDKGEIPLASSINLDILVVESNKKAPRFNTIRPKSPIILLENLTDYSYDIATLTAFSNTDEEASVFELVTGRTEQTNKLGTFRLESDGDTAHIRLARPMDYESIADYTLTIRLQNKYNLAAETSISIQLEDVNDNIPAFTEVVNGVVLENEPPGSPVMQVRAIDADSTTAHNQVKYELGDNKDNFKIDPNTGNITTLKVFDREEQDFYNVKVIATDNSPSVLYTTGEHNKGQQVFRIEIADKNDHPPKFTKSEYTAEAVTENANINELVTEVKALDNDTASSVSYSIIKGNEANSFSIEEKTGKIRVENKLDYEVITSYTLHVRAFDGAFDDFCTVNIKIENVNDNPPVFAPFNNITIEEETLVEECIVKLEAYDPDIPDRNEPQHIKYFVVKMEQQKLLKMDANGCLSLIKPLDRDPPNGFEIWQVLVGAADDDGIPNSLQQTADVFITLRDINDNAPYLDMVQPVVWRENQEPGPIKNLTAKDNDGPKNGPPFTFSIASTASDDIQSKFSIRDNELLALVTFDREEKKSYMVPIAITDSGSPSKTGTSTLQVDIGDENDNQMKEGHSSIFVYNYKSEAPDTEIGRVYVEDPDDWDISDKIFHWVDSPHPNFDLNTDTGMITMLQGTMDQTYLLQFRVTEKSIKITKHTVMASVNVTVKEISEEAVDKSGSIRFAGITAEEFIKPDKNGINKQIVLRRYLAKSFNISEENVDVFTVLHSPLNNASSIQLDVRFSAHGSPYYMPEKLNAEVSRNKEELEQKLGVTMLMINIDECLIEKLHCTISCTNVLQKKNVPVAVYTNTTSFVGVNAVVEPVCSCEPPDRIVCHNGGTPVGNLCECSDGYEGPHCEIVAIGFSGDGWALYPPFETCASSRVSLELRPNKPNGLVFYIGPTNPNLALHVQDFMSLEIQNGFPVLLVDFGTGTVRIEQPQIPLNVGEQHRIDIFWTETYIELQVDDCKLPTCLKLTLPVGPNEYLNVNGPLQVGGSFIDLVHLGNSMNWTYKPSNVGFSGCVKNFTFNGKLYNLGSPSLSKNVDLSCSSGLAIAISFGIDTSFLVAIFICIAILLILLLAVVVHRRKTDDFYKDTDDTRTNIINYEDEGGGEVDNGYDLNVMRILYPIQDKHQPDHLMQRPGGDEVPDICGFLDGKKQSVDNDPETNPFDDVRHYAYEGDGNTTGSLSSLASGTDEGDLNFDYLSNFGPRFRKLADMYGEDPSDEEEDNFQHTASESWC